MVIILPIVHNIYENLTSTKSRVYIITLLYHAVIKIKTRYFHLKKIFFFISFYGGPIVSPFDSKRVVKPIMPVKSISRYLPTQTCMYIIILFFYKFENVLNEQYNDIQSADTIPKLFYDIILKHPANND